jgi:hypothetical protein
LSQSISAFGNSRKPQVCCLWTFTLCLRLITYVRVFGVLGIGHRYSDRIKHKKIKLFL